MRERGRRETHDDGGNEGSHSCLDQSRRDVLETTNVFDVLSFLGRELVREIWEG